MAQVTVGWEAVRVAGRRMELARVGSSAADPPFVFLHGWGLSPRTYLPCLSALSERSGRAVLALTLPGFGRSDALPVRSQGITGVAEHVAATLDVLGVGGADLVGHSFGGGVALRVGATRPDLVASLVLVSPVGGAGAGAVPLHRVLGGLVRDGLHGWTPRALAADLVPAARRHPTAVIGSGLAAWRADLVRDVEAVDGHGIPALVAFAEQDSVVRAGAIPTVACDHVRCCSVPGRHSWLLTEPERFVSLLTSDPAELGFPLPPAA